MKLYESEWANGQASLDIDDYYYNETYFMEVLTTLCEFYEVVVPEIIIGLDTIVADIQKNGQLITLLMDNYFFQ